VASATVKVDGTSGGVLHVSVRNASRFPVTILGLAATPATPSSLRGVYFEGDPYGPGQGIGTDHHLQRQVRLGHDEEAGVLLEVRFPDCLGHDKGTSAIYSSVPLRVRRLGITRTVQLPLELPLWVDAETDHKATGTCHS
jgi:hypothetical protein